MAADAAFFWLLLSALATLPALRASWRSLRRAEIACLGSLVALAWWLRAWLRFNPDLLPASALLPNRDGHTMTRRAAVMGQRRVQARPRLLVRG